MYRRRPGGMSVQMSCENDQSFAKRQDSPECKAEFMSARLEVVAIEEKDKQ